MLPCSVNLLLVTNTAFFLKRSVSLTADMLYLKLIKFEAQILQVQLKRAKTKAIKQLLGTHCCKYACIADDSKVYLLFIIRDSFIVEKEIDLEGTTEASCFNIFLTPNGLKIDGCFYDLLITQKTWT